MLQETFKKEKIPFRVSEIDMCSEEILLYSNSGFTLSERKRKEDEGRRKKERGHWLLDEFIDFERNYKENNSDLRRGIVNTVSKNLSNVILKSPITSKEVYLYRCIKTKLNNNVGDVLDNLGFMYLQMKSFWYSSN